MLTIEQRLSRLERNSNRWRSGCILSVLLLIAIVSVGADIDPFADPKENLKVTKFEDLHCRRLIVENEKGRANVVLMATANGGALGIPTNDKVLMVYGDDVTAGMSVIRVPDKQTLLDAHAGNDLQIIRLGGTDATYAAQLLRTPDRAALDLSTLRNQSVTLQALKSGGSGFISNMDANAKILLLAPEFARPTTKAEIERNGLQQNGK